MGKWQGALESLVICTDFWRGKRVFLTGHTGFKGSWLALWLRDMGARVYGYALAPPTEPNLFSVLGLQDRLTASSIGDVRDAEGLQQAVKAACPDVVLHLAAQSLVRESYESPVDTYMVNVIGTVNLLEAVRMQSSIKAVVNVTTDKCYENREWLWPYRENEALGGFDPYSSSKACAELVTSAYRNSFLSASAVWIASARAGNVIGGGDWASDRLIPDFLRSLDNGEELTIRSPDATRPWQHVLEPLAGYLMLAQRLFVDGAEYAEAWNFGPEAADARPVRWLVEYLCSQLPTASWRCDTELHPHEATSLNLDSTKAKARLGWRPQWDLKTALEMTLGWHQSWRQGADMSAFTLQQIRAYQAAAEELQ